MSNACDRGAERLVSLLYEDGDQGQLLEMRAHLASCAECRAELDRLGGTRELLGAWPNAVNAPRMVYVNEGSGFLTRVRRWADAIVGLGPSSMFRPMVASAAAMILVLVAAAAVLDVRVAPDGSLEVGLGSRPAESSPAVSREELQEGFELMVSHVEELLRSRSEEERRLLLAAIDERMQEQGLAMSRQLRGAVDAVFTDMQRQHESDLGLIFSAIDELGVGTEIGLQQMNAILASLAQPGPTFEEE